jgi:hypothetical protein
MPQLMPWQLRLFQGSNIPSELADDIQEHAVIIHA